VIRAAPSFPAGEGIDLRDSAGLVMQELTEATGQNAAGIAYTWMVMNHPSRDKKHDGQNPHDETFESCRYSGPIRLDDRRMPWRRARSADAVYNRRGSAAGIAGVSQ
jgi:hypothetical protein